MAFTKEQAEARKAEAAHTRYAAYDNTYLRFIGRVLDTKKAVSDQDVVKNAKGDVEIREV